MFNQISLQIECKITYLIFWLSPQALNKSKKAQVCFLVFFGFITLPMCSPCWSIFFLVAAWLSCLWLLQEVEALLSETEMLQGKLHSQEEDFRLQNSTLMAELSKVTTLPCWLSQWPLFGGSASSTRILSQLCTQIEQLEQENRGLKEVGEATADPASSLVDGELLRLQAENATLQKKMRGVCFTLWLHWIEITLHFIVGTHPEQTTGNVFDFHT